MSFIAGAAAGAVLALMVSWYIRHPDERTDANEAATERSKEREEHERFVKEQQRQFDKLMQYTGKDQRA